MKSEELLKKWEKFVIYSKNNGFLHYIGNLSFISHKTGDILTLLGDDKVSIQKKGSILDAEFEEKEKKD